MHGAISSTLLILQGLIQSKRGKILSFHAKELRVYQKRKDRQRYGVWPSVPTWSHKRQLPFRARIDIGANERQAMLHSTTGRTRETIWRKYSKDRCLRQGILEYGQFQGTSAHGKEHRRFA